MRVKICISLSSRQFSEVFRYTQHLFFSYREEEGGEINIARKVWVKKLKEWSGKRQLRGVIAAGSTLTV